MEIKGQAGAEEEKEEDFEDAESSSEDEKTKGRPLGGKGSSKRK